MKLEQQALQKEDDDASRKRLEMLEKEMAEKEREYSELEEVWKSEKAALSGTQHIKAELDHVCTQMEQARRASDFAKMSELQYGVIPQLEKQLNKRKPRKVKR